MGVKVYITTGKSLPMSNKLIVFRVSFIRVATASLGLDVLLSQYASRACNYKPFERTGSIK
jgi:hypothetical protein